MCGIAGITSSGGFDDTARLQPSLDRAVARLRRRGPDAEATWRDRHCALAHTRLAVIDLSPRAAQPMAAHGCVISYNGEIYNFAELREELTNAGYRFNSDSDTEVLLAGWSAWRTHLLSRLIGMFALAIWDPTEQLLILARDRFGQKPLLYSGDASGIAFASDLVALSALKPDVGDISADALRLYMALGYVPEPWSILAGATKLPPGHLLFWRPQSAPKVQRWYDLANHRTPRFADPAAAASAIRRAIDAATRARLVADVPVGAFLSGGIDSTIVAASLASQGHQLTTFTLGFKGASDYYEERPAARRTADALGLRHTEIEVGPDQTRNVVPDVLENFDEPFADSSALPTYLLSRFVREHVTVALTGDGADEVFGGYRKYQGELRAAEYRRLPPVLRAAIEPAIRALPESKDSKLLEHVRRARRFTAHAGKAPAERHAGWASRHDDDVLSDLLGTDGISVASLVNQLRGPYRNDDCLNQVLFTDIAMVLPGDMLVKVDRMTMAHGLEARCPFLDQRVVECAARMPGDFKLQQGAGKVVLRRAFADCVPDEVFNLPKKGFEVPIANWLTGPLREMCLNAIEPGRLRRQGIFDPDIPQRWWRSLVAGRRDTAAALWSIIAFQAWDERRQSSAA